MVRDHLKECYESPRTFTVNFCIHFVKTFGEECGTNCDPARSHLGAEPEMPQNVCTTYFRVQPRKLVLPPQAAVLAVRSVSLSGPRTTTTFLKVPINDLPDIVSAALAEHFQGPEQLC